MSQNKNQISLSAIEEVFDRKLLPIAMKLDQCVTTVEGLVQSVSVISDKFDEISTKVEDLEGKYMKVNQENKFLKDEVFRLSNSLNSVKEDIDNFEQYSRRVCIEVSGVPVTTDEDTSDLVVELGSIIGLNIKREDISVSHRLPVKMYSQAIQNKDTLNPGRIWKIYDHNVVSTAR
ncbi:Hypothetical predicted protein [Paramuricea clavata]|uniref:Uncharacterized protein n=1 Tax=Paramuricea clavata TaxID=317549 RepID=A0A7D9EER5_PARCT|nr:Hypothetical predicted protein [Paramuricea clavata]